MFRARLTLPKTLVLAVTASFVLLLTACGGPSSPSAPAAPTNVVATPGPGYMTVSWDHDGKDAESFEIYRTGATGAMRSQADAPIGSVTAEARSFKDDDIVAGAAYDYSVVAKGAGGSSDAATPTGGSITLEPGIDLVVGTYTSALFSQDGTALGIYWYLTEAQAAAVVGRARLSGPSGWNSDQAFEFGPTTFSNEPGFFWQGVFNPVVGGTYQVTLEVGGETFTASTVVDVSQSVTPPENVEVVISGNKVTDVSWDPATGSVSHWVRVYQGDLGDYTTVDTKTTTESHTSFPDSDLAAGPHFVGVIGASLDVTEDLPTKTGQLNAGFTVSEPFTIESAAQCTDPASIVAIPDENLEQAIREALPKATGDLTCADMGTLTELDWNWPGNDKRIRNLEGLQHAVNLERLFVGGNRDLPNLAALDGLPKLRELDVSWTRITQDDAAVLQSLPALELVHVSGRMFSDLSFLTNIPTLESLYACCTQLDGADFAFLADLEQLHSLDIRENRLTSADLDPIANLTELNFINLSRNSIDDFSVLAGMTELRDVNLSNLGITDLADIPNLGQLRWVELQDNNLTDISALTTDLYHVELQGNYLDLTPGSSAMTKIAELQNGGVEVEYEPQFPGGACVTALASSDAVFHQVDVNGTYLDSDPGEVTNPPTTIDLAALGVEGGDCIGLRATGAFSYWPGDDADLGEWLAAVFSDGSGTVPTEGVVDYVSRTCSGADNDIADDFEVSPHSFLYFEVPSGATELLLAPYDCDAHNNSDADGDFGILMRH